MLVSVGIYGFISFLTMVALSKVGGILSRSFDIDLPTSANLLMIIIPAFVAGAVYADTPDSTLARLTRLKGTAAMWVFAVIFMFGIDIIMGRLDDISYTLRDTQAILLLSGVLAAFFAIIYVFFGLGHKWQIGANDRRKRKKDLS